MSENYDRSQLQELGKQSPPIPNDSTAIWDLVVQDMKARNLEGIKKYGTPLQAGNGRDSLLDAYEEALDLTVYLRTELENRKIELEKDRKFLTWIYHRLIDVHGENRNFDYMRRFKSMIDR